MTGNAIELQDLGKCYRLGEHHLGRSVREALAQRARRPSRAREIEEIWSLRDITLEISEGDALGVVGRNGAGKSTLLKILARITEPTIGVSSTRGRVASLLEVGTGFHPELTGRENVYLNGAILGMSRREITQRFDRIVAFAGVERFLDTPVKRYSSGMYLRLAFAVAAHVEPDILLIDEVLTVGDTEFQRKCLGKMSLDEREGRTVVFVSHDLEAVGRLCPTAVWLDQGRIRAQGPTRDVIHEYLSSGVQAGSGAVFEDHSDQPLGFRSVAVTDEVGRQAQVLRRDQRFVIEVRFTVRTSIPGPDLAIYVENAGGVRVFDEAWSDTAVNRLLKPGHYVARITVPPVLNVGDYHIGVWSGTTHETFLDERNVIKFRLEGGIKKRPDRVVELLLPWAVEEDPEPAGASAVLPPHQHDKRQSNR